MAVINLYSGVPSPGSYKLRPESRRREIGKKHAAVAAVHLALVSNFLGLTPEMFSLSPCGASPGNFYF